MITNVLLFAFINAYYYLLDVCYFLAFIASSPVFLLLWKLSTQGKSGRVSRNITDKNTGQEQNRLTVEFSSVR